MTPQPDLALVADMLDRLAILTESRLPEQGDYRINAIREQARLLREADNAHKARTVNRSAASEASPAEQVGEDGLLLAVVGRVHFGNPIPAEWYAAARDLIRRLTTPEQPGSAPQGDAVRPGYRHTVHELLTNIKRTCIRGRSAAQTESNMISTCDHIENLADEAIGYLTTPPPAPAAEQGQCNHDEADVCPKCELRWRSLTERPAAPGAGVGVDEAARALVAKIEAIHADPRYQGVWVCAHNHGQPYTGPSYEAELDTLTAALAGKEKA